MAQPLKILVCGDVDGKFSQLFHRIKTVQRKAGQFDLLFCVGSFFGDDNSEWEEYRSGSTPVPIQMYILGPCQPQHRGLYPDPDGGDLCENVTYLGQKGMFTGSSGLSVAYLSSTEAATADDCHFSPDTVKSLMTSLTEAPGFQGVDILLTSQWPEGVEKYALSSEGGDTSQSCSPLISQLALSLKPRYHFCALRGTFYERQPYRNHKVLYQSSLHVTRFIALSKVGNPHKTKFLYAFNLTPLKEAGASDVTKQPEDTTECPYTADPSVFTRHAPATPNEESKSQFFYDMKPPAERENRKRPHNRDQDGEPREKKPVTPKGPCWFCLGSPDVEKHLVVSVGQHNYLALAKGGLTPDHALILPIVHHQSLVSSPLQIVEEINKYKEALKRCFKPQGKVLVFFERNYRTQHLQIQAVPIPAHLACEVKDTLLETAQHHKFELHELPEFTDVRQVVPVGAPYFYAELPSGEKFLHRISHRNFPLHFGREVLCQPNILNMTERIDWKDCKISTETEEDMTRDFRRMFKKYDFSLS